MSLSGLNTDGSSFSSSSAVSPIIQQPARSVSSSINGSGLQQSASDQLARFIHAQQQQQHQHQQQQQPASYHPPTTEALRSLATSQQQQQQQRYNFLTTSPGAGVGDAAIAAALQSYFSGANSNHTRSSPYAPAMSPSSSTDARVSTPSGAVLRARDRSDSLSVQMNPIPQLTSVPPSLPSDRIAIPGSSHHPHSKSSSGTAASSWAALSPGGSLTSPSMSFGRLDSASMARSPSGTSYTSSSGRLAASSPAHDWSSAASSSSYSSHGAWDNGVAQHPHYHPHQQPPTQQIRSWSPPGSGFGVDTNGVVRQAMAPPGAIGERPSMAMMRNLSSSSNGSAGMGGRGVW